MKKYKIYDLAYEGVNLDDVELDDDWYVDEEDNVCHDCKSVGEFVDSLQYNLNTYLEGEDWVFYEKTYGDVLCDLLENGYIEVNGFGYEIVD